MTVLQFFKMLALFLLVTPTTASPVAIPATNGVSISITIPGDVSIAVPAGISGDIPNDVTTEVNHYRCVYTTLFCKQAGLTENQCFELQCKDPNCYRCRSSCRNAQQADGSDSTTVNSVAAESSPPSCVGDDGIAALKANNALVLDEADMKSDTTISVTSSHAQLRKPFLYHCNWTSGICWTDPILQAVAGTDISMEEIPDIPTKVCREVCSADESLCGMICDVDENDDKHVDVAYHGLKCYWECMFGQCWTVCMPNMAVGSAHANVVMGAVSLKCRWECYFGQCHTSCVAPAKEDAAEKRGTSAPPCHERCDDDKCWIVCPRARTE
ncbi:hypothetical protein G6011_11068 [Alternaria panax]|uniref:Uncharacterized protein n=1 Tax=Alternaria panax TaxID=48097 RepID=A0AAD4ID47_9PLEO|nr:hypothetical protein G6011_11068 [Alternaria panax]